MDTDNHNLKIYREEPLVQTEPKLSGPIDPPWFDGIEDQEPNDDFGEPKKRSSIDEACREFRKYFEKEPWFVRLLKTETQGYIVCIVDARYFPKGRVRHKPWRGFPVVVGHLTGFAADAERKALTEWAERSHPALPTPQKLTEDFIVEAINAFQQKYGNKKWYLGNWAYAADDGSVYMHVRVDYRYWRADRPQVYQYDGHEFPMVVHALPPDLADQMKNGGGE